MKKYKTPIPSCSGSHPNRPLFLQEAMKDYYQQRVHQSWQGGHILKGQIAGASALRFENNDYLGLSTHPQMIETMKASLTENGTGQMQSVVFHSQNHLLLQTESEYAQWLQKESSLIAQSGWCANVGLIQAIAKRNVPIYLDYHAHMSLWEGARSAGAKPIPFAHNNIDSLAKRVRRFGPGMIAVDSIYSTNGSLSPLAKYVELAKDHQCLLIVDESHALGVLGPCGGGLVAEAGLSSEVDFITSSLSKAMAGRGGVIAGDEELIELIRYNAYPTIFSTGLMPHDLSGFRKGLSIVKQELWRQRFLQQLCIYMNQKLNGISVQTTITPNHIVPLLCGHERDAIWLREQLEKEQIFGAVFCYPATPKEKSLIRLSLTVNHSKEDIDHVCKQLKIIKSKRSSLPLFN